MTYGVTRLLCPTAACPTLSSMKLYRFEIGHYVSTKKIATAGYFGFFRCGHADEEVIMQGTKSEYSPAGGANKLNTAICVVSPRSQWIVHTDESLALYPNSFCTRVKVIPKFFGQLNFVKISFLNPNRKFAHFAEQSIRAEVYIWHFFSIFQWISNVWTVNIEMLFHDCFI